MCLVWVLTSKTDKMLTEEGSEGSTNGDSETAPLLAVSRVPCLEKNGSKNGRQLWEILKARERRARKCVQGHKNVGTERCHSWLGCCNCTWVPKPLARFMEKKFAQGY